MTEGRKPVRGVIGRGNGGQGEEACRQVRAIKSLIKSECEERQVFAGHYGNKFTSLFAVSDKMSRPHSN